MAGANVACSGTGDRFVLVDLPTRGALHEASLAPSHWQLRREGTLLDSWATELPPKLTRGAVLIIDYGYPWAEYYAPHRTGGTLDAIADTVGSIHWKTLVKSDLTAHVEFTTLAQLAEDAGLRVAGFTDQHHFLTALAAHHFP
jgi:SAM-dependent MidA family methyltransferase